MSYPYGTKIAGSQNGLPRKGGLQGMSSFPVVGNGLPGLPRRGGKSAPPGQVAFTTPGTYIWECPPGVFSVSVVCVGGGSNGGGGLGYTNDRSVTPGDSYTVVVGARGTESTAAGDSYFINTSTVRGGGGGTFGGPGTFHGDGGGNGGGGSGGGGGAGGYSGAGGPGGGIIGFDGSGVMAGTAGNGGGGGGGATAWLDFGNVFGGGGGGGVGLLGQGSNGAGGATPFNGGGGGSGGSGGSNGSYGVGAAGGSFGGGVGRGHSSAGLAGTGAVRIIWPGTERQFPSTRTADE